MLQGVHTENHHFHSFCNIFWFAFSSLYDCTGFSNSFALFFLYIFPIVLLKFKFLSFIRISKCFAMVSEFFYGFRVLYIFTTVLLYTYFLWFLLCFYSFTHISNGFCLFVFGGPLFFCHFSEFSWILSTSKICIYFQCFSCVYSTFFFCVFLVLHIFPMVFARFFS